MSVRGVGFWVLILLPTLVAAGPMDLPPLDLAGSVDPVLTLPGDPVSRPLTSCCESAEPPLVVDRYLAEAPALRPLTTWTTLEYLAWWPKGPPVPPLVTAGRGVPVPGGPATSTLIGGGAAAAQLTSGGRFSKGFTLDDAGTTAVAVTYFFLGTRTDDIAAFGRSQSTRQVGRPFVDATTGEWGIIPVGGGGFDGAVRVARSVRVTGWEVTGLFTMMQAPAVTLNVLTGYRYFALTEGLIIAQVASTPLGVAAALEDRFDTRTRFHGGQFGLLADFSQGNFLVELTTKVAVGQGTSIVDVRGASVARTATNGLEAFPAGLLAVESNSGRRSQSAFTVLPEAAVKLGYIFPARGRVYLGYNFLYLSDAVRPGHQVDPVVDLAQVPLNQRTTSLGDRPGPMFARSDFWAQGLVLGLEYRY